MKCRYRLNALSKFSNGATNGLNRSLLIQTIETELTLFNVKIDALIKCNARNFMAASNLMDTEALRIVPELTEVMEELLGILEPHLPCYAKLHGMTATDVFIEIY